MRRTLGMLSTLTILATPLSALALAGSPAALLPQMDFKGNPHAVEAEFHAAGNGIHAALWMKGAQEGRTPATTKAWWKMTMDLEGNGMQGRVKMAATLYQNTLYFKVMSVDGNFAEGMKEIATLAGKPWVKIPIPGAASQAHSFAEGWAAGMRQAGADISDEDVRLLVSGLFDALFTLESTRYQSGMAYSLHLAPDYLHRALRAVQTSALSRELGFRTEEMNLPEELPVNMHIRVNTNSIGELVFLKWYVATDAEGISVVAQGKSQWQASPVYVEIPKETITMDEFLEDMGMEDIGLDQWEMPSMDTDMWEEPLEEDDGSQEQSPMETVRPYRALPPRVRRLEAPRMREGCTAMPGTSFYLQQARKGQCDLPPRSTYRVNDKDDRSDHRM